VTDDFRDVLLSFVNAGVRFLVVGAHALAAHGIPRTTGDLDLWVEPTEQNADRVWNALATFGARLEALGVRREDFRRADVVAQFGLPPYRIDVMTNISGVTFDEAWRDRLVGDMLGVSVAFHGREEFLKNKRASGRSKDLRDIEALE
jgi:hypothetical protein